MTKPKPSGFDQPLNCPHCKVSLLGEPIPPKDKDKYSGNYFKREIGQYNMDADMVVAYRCPDCDKVWRR